MATVIRGGYGRTVAINRHLVGWCGAVSHSPVIGTGSPGYHFAEGYSWYYADSGFVIVSVATGMIVYSIADGW
ncbi:hypothetical protein [Acetobacter sp. DsW_063]|uniref:hypothetical protein n=1 Tax=Acetobacter sp. DsW_063 TaxID=1514894 RepID=UPI00117775FB|nr:hypothetical protein [Acetobacter sp. DsW_063]